MIAAPRQSSPRWALIPLALGLLAAVLIVADCGDVAQPGGPEAPTDARAALS